jgi:hypothetical protein
MRFALPFLFSTLLLLPGLACAETTVFPPENAEECGVNGAISLT